MPVNPSGDEPETDSGHPCIDCGDACDCGEEDDSYCLSCSTCQEHDRFAEEETDDDNEDDEEEPLDDPDDDEDE